MRNFEKLKVKNVWKTISKKATTVRMDADIDEAMHHPIFVYENDLLLKILKSMVDEKVQELPVVNSEKKIIGDLNCLEILKGFWKL